MPTYKEVIEFVQNQTKTLGRVSENDVKPSKSKGKSKVTQSFFAKTNVSPKESSNKTNCLACGETHLIYHCSKFLELDPNSRHKFSRE